MSMEIGAYGGILQNYRIPPEPAAGAEEIRKPDAQQPDIKQSPEIHAYEEPEAVRKPDAQLEDISITFNRQDDFGYIGKDSDIHSLDVERAITDMQKDKVLQQYQYFVGDSSNLYMQHQSGDGIVIPKF